MRAAPMCSVSRAGSRMVPGGRRMVPGGRRCAGGRGVRRTSITLVTVHRPAWMSAMPRCSSRVLTPRRFSATRATPLTSPAGVPSDCTPLIRSVRMEGVSASSSPARTVPACRVPVTTVPLPLMANTRSSHSRTPLRGSGRGRRAASLPSAATRSGRPWPVSALTATASILVWPRLVSAILSVACRSAGAGSARSARVTTRIPWRTPRASIAARCSADWGFQPSSAATTNITAGAGPAPASMLDTNRSCPGTSTNAISSPDGSVVHAKPRSMVMPRRRSASQRSGSIPVSARTSMDFP